MQSLRSLEELPEKLRNASINKKGESLKKAVQKNTLKVRIENGKPKEMNLGIIHKRKKYQKSLEALVSSERKSSTLRQGFEIIGGNKWALTLIKSTDDFKRVLESLTEEQRTAVYEALKEKLPTITKDSAGFRDVLQYLTQEQRTVVYETLKVKLPFIIKDSAGFRDVLQYLTSEQCKIICKTLEKTQPSIIQSGTDLKYVLEHLTPEQCKSVCEALKEILSAIIDNCGFINFILYLTPEQCQFICKALKEKLSFIIKNGTKFRDTLIHLREKQRTIVYETLKEEFPSIIKDSDSFRDALEYLTPEQCKNVCELLKDKLPSIIKDSNSFRDALEYLTPEQRKNVYEALKDKLPSIIKDDKDLQADKVKILIEQSLETNNEDNYLNLVKKEDKSESMERITNILQTDKKTKNLITKLKEYGEKFKSHSSSLARAKSSSLFKIVDKCNKPEAQVDDIIKIIRLENEILSKHRHPSMFNCFFSLFFKSATLENRITSLKLVNDLNSHLLDCKKSFTVS
jgi:hypothetical protein